MVDATDLTGPSGLTDLQRILLANGLNQGTMPGGPVTGGQAPMLSAQLQPYSAMQQSVPYQGMSPPPAQNNFLNASPQAFSGSQQVGPGGGGYGIGGFSPPPNMTRSG